MNEIEIAARVVGDMPAITEKAVARIEAGMIEHRRACKIFGRDDSQTTRKLMTLTMLSAAPYRQLRQCVAEIQQRSLAVKESAFRARRLALEAKQYREEAERLSGTDAQLALLSAEERESQIETMKVYLEGALKDIAALQEAYTQIRTTHGIRENWDEEDYEQGEIEHHLKSAFRLAYRDVLQGGRLAGGTLEYLEQFGVHPQVALVETIHYAQQVEQAVNSGNAYNIGHFHDWLDRQYARHKDDVKEAVKRLGLTELITRWSLYIEPEKPA